MKQKNRHNLRDSESKERKEGWSMKDSCGKGVETRGISE